MDGLQEQLSPGIRATEVKKARATLVTLEGEIANLTRAIAVGGDLDSLVRELRDRDARRRDLLAVIAASHTALRYDLKAIERMARTNLDAWRALLASESVADRRQFMREAFAGALVLTPDGARYLFHGEINHGPLITGTIGDDGQRVWRARRDLNPRPTGSKPAALSS